MKRATIRVAALSLLLLAALHFTSLAARAAEGGYTNYFSGFYGDFGIAVAPDPGPYFTHEANSLKDRQCVSKSR